jgi:hypothetical protein
MKYDEWRGARHQHNAAIVKEILLENRARLRLAARRPWRSARLRWIVSEQIVSELKNRARAWEAKEANSLVGAVPADPFDP